MHSPASWILFLCSTARYRDVQRILCALSGSRPSSRLRHRLLPTGGLPSASRWTAQRRNVCVAVTLACLLSVQLTGSTSFARDADALPSSAPSIATAVAAPADSQPAPAAEQLNGLASPTRNAVAARQLFEERVGPLLQQHCVECHAGTLAEPAGGLVLDTAQGLQRGGETGPAVVPGNVPASLLIAALRHEGLAMPPDQPALPAEEVAAVVKWVELGAADPRAIAAASPGAWANSAAVRAASGQAAAERAGREYWAFQPLAPAELPSVQHLDWPANWLDYYVLAELEQHDLAPAPPASPAVWLRRVTYDLTGLPPTPEQITAFEANAGPRARAAVVDRLLASPAFGEKMAQAWLDLVRFAESEGFEYDNPIPEAWRYRDYVIRAWNDDRPFDQFVREQLSGDEYDGRDPERLSAATFHRLGAVRRNAGNQLVAASRNEVLTERTDILGAAFLGLTVGCARCHHHKFDPISQKDYYRLQAFLAATDEADVMLAPVSEGQWAVDDTANALQEQLRQLRRQLAAADAPSKPALEQQIKSLTAQLPTNGGVIPTVMNRPEDRTPIHVLTRGEWGRPGERVTPRGLEVLTAESSAELSEDAERPRTELARWLITDAQPLVARVQANRLWLAFFGQGLVRTPNDFGVHGDRPSHPGLLDRLAHELLRDGWRRKNLVRQIVLSSTYAQSSQPEAAMAERLQAVDPANRWLAKFPRRRLTAEELRDSLWEVAGELNRRSGGPSVVVPVDPELVKLLYKPAQWTPTSDPIAWQRRSIYLLSKRNLRIPFLEVFDQPIGQLSTPNRLATTHAPQALELLNGELTNRVAEFFASRLQRECGDSVAERIRRGFQLTQGRLPTERELAASMEFLQAGSHQESVWQEFALALFNLNGFLYVE